MSKKATHKGHCQVCGACQKLPGGFLSLHGYTVQWGFFSGTCTGADHLPFEQSKGLVEGAIARALLQAKSIKEHQAQLREPVAPGTTATTVRVFFGSTRLGPDYRWTKVELYSTTRVVNEGKEGEYRFNSYYYPPVPGAEKGIGGERFREVCAYQSVPSIEAAVALCNEAYAASMDKTLAEIAKYVSWQRERIKGWKPQPLLALK